MAQVWNAVLLALLSTTSFAQEQITWGSVVFTYHGEKTPLLSKSSHELTPVGAQQLYNTGRIIRERYISPPANSTRPRRAVINGLSKNIITNSQLDILSLDDEYQTASALAFMQGLYPPNGQLVLNEETLYQPGNGGNGSIVMYPLDGYQYPNIETVSDLDLSYVWIAGNIGCDNYSLAEVQYKNSSAYQNRISSTFSFYQSLRSSGNVFAALSPSILDFRYASQLFEYALYEYNHNRTIYNSDEFSSEDLAMLYDLASEQQFAINSPNSEGTIASIAGRTLASKVLQQLKRVVVTDGLSNKMTLMFTSYEPFLSFFALSNLSVGPSGSKFKSMPLHGSTMSFELFSYASSSSSASSSPTFPSTSDLWVRFLFRNGTDSDQDLTAYSLFGRGMNQMDMSWNEFVRGMGTFALDDVGEWCDICETNNLFCAALNANENSGDGSLLGAGSRSKALSPVVYGVIGAVVTLAIAVMGLIILALFGFRLHKNEKAARGADAGGLGVLRTASGNGGFKGAEKLASDTDLRLKGGAGATVVRHERIGSWELNDSPTSPRTTLNDSLRSKDLEAGRVVSRADYGRRSEDDGVENVNPFGDPVKPADQV